MNKASGGVAPSCSVQFSRLFHSDEHFVELHSSRLPNVASGSFVYDADTNFPRLESDQDRFTYGLLRHAQTSEKAFALRTSGRSSADYTAKVMFEDNKHKLKQIPSIAAIGSKDGSTITMTWLGDMWTSVEADGWRLEFT